MTRSWMARSSPSVRSSSPAERAELGDGGALAREGKRDARRFRGRPGYQAMFLKIPHSVRRVHGTPCTRRSVSSCAGAAARQVTVPHSSILLFDPRRQFDTSALRGTRRNKPGTAKDRDREIGRIRICEIKGLTDGIHEPRREVGADRRRRDIPRSSSGRGPHRDQYWSYLGASTPRSGPR